MPGCVEFVGTCMTRTLNVHRNIVLADAGFTPGNRYDGSDNQYDSPPRTSMIHPQEPVIWKMGEAE
eukprot:351171-Chlamydomonas_euryale.AAC.3